MARYSSDMTVLGAIILSVLGTPRVEELDRFFQKYGLSDYDPNQYYPVKPLLNMVQDILRERQGMDSMYDLVSMGIANGLSIPLPAEIDSMEKWLLAWEARHHMLYRGTEIGYVKCEKLSDTCFQARVCWPWPDDIAYGTVYGMCKRFLPGADFNVYYDEDAVRADHGGSETILHVEW